jgi:tRNA A-37 threonylcarbamoyl transferase component Bud32
MAQAIASIAVLVETLRQHQLLAAAELRELGLFQHGCSDPRDLARELLRRNWLTPYQVNQLLQGNVGELFVGPYLVLERLDEGGQGQIFKARHRHMERVIALKVLHKESLDDPENLARFQRESKIIRQLDHPNVVHAYDAGPVGANFYLAMEFVEGVNLWQYVKKQGPLAPGVAADCVRQAALGLQHIHERGLVHRDIKPSNLVLTRNNLGVSVVKILDMGLARRMQPIHGEATEKLTTDQSGALGTVDYMAPEQALDFHRADIRADIYSLGYTLYFLLTGTPPFGSATVAQKLIWHQQREPAPVEQHARGVPSSLVQILKQMTAKDPAARFQLPGDVARALTGQPVSIPLKPPSAPIARIVIDPMLRNTPKNGATPLPRVVPVPVSVAPLPSMARRLRKIAILGGLVGAACFVLLAVVLAGTLRKKDLVVNKPGKGGDTLPDKPSRDRDPDKNPGPADPQPSGVALLAIDKGQLPSDTGSNIRFFSIDEHSPIGKALKVAFPAGDSFGDRVAPPLNDWTTFTGLQFDVFNPDSNSYVLHFNVTHRRSTSYPTRIDAPFQVKSGKNRIKIPIPPMANVNGSTPDLANIVKWYISVEGGKTPTLYFSNIALEGGDVIIQGKPFVHDVLLDSQQASATLGGERKSNAIKKSDLPSVFLVSFEVEKFQAALRARTIEKATVSFYVWDPSNQGKTLVKAFPVLTPWQESSASWLAPSPGKQWRGKPPKPGGVCAFEIGVDTGPAAIGSVIVLPDPPGMDIAEPPLEYQLDITDIVRGWLEKKLENNGVAIAGVPDRDIDQNQLTRFQIFASEYDRPQFSPKLHIRLKR